LDLSGSRFVVCALGGRRGFLELPESVTGTGRESISGGERSLYELATALAVLGADVELRGELHPRILDTITGAAGTGPRVGLEPRRPELGEVVVLPEGSENPDLFLAAHLSGAQTVVLLLGPPGLYGWSFLAGWKPPDLLAVDVSTVGVPATYRAIAALGFSMWSNARGIAEAGRRAGVAVTWTGTGTPVPFPDPPAKTADIAVIEVNHWFPLADGIARRLIGASVLQVSPRWSEYSLAEALGPARILPWPSRVEGASRIEREARAVGTVPVALDINPFATTRDHGDGTVLVHDLEELLRETDRLLHAPDELAERAVRTARSARAEADWGEFLERVSAAVHDLPVSPSSEARAELGLRMVVEHARVLDALRREAESRAAEVAGRAAEAAGRAAEVAGRAAEAAGRAAEAAGRAAEAAGRAAEAEGRAAALADLAGARDQLAAYRSRRVIRLLDDSRIAGAIHAVAGGRRSGSRPEPPSGDR
jgi:hypothetical protein